MFIVNLNIKLFTSGNILNKFTEITIEIIIINIVIALVIEVYKNLNNWTIKFKNTQNYF